MKILLAHNYYQQAGGEDRVFLDEAELLESRGHDVLRFELRNDGLENQSKLKLAASTVWNRHSAAAIAEVVRKNRVSVVHFHNTLPRISPASYYAARRAGAAVVQTLHNFRLICPSATFLRDGQVCESCLGKFLPWPGIVHRCYRESRGATAAVAGMLATHRLLRTWKRAVDVYIALTEFTRERFIAGGLPAERIAVKPNFVIDPPQIGVGGGGYALFVGRLSEEKGIATLLDAWRRLGSAIPLRVVGDGPLAGNVQSAAAADARITWLGKQPAAEVARQMADAACLLMPSIWYENLPKTLVESYSVGTPVIASRLGAMAELVEHGRTGFLFEPRDGADLAAQVERLFGDDQEQARLRRAARAEFEERYTADDNYRLLMDIYERATARLHGAPAAQPFIPSLATREIA